MANVPVISFNAGELSPLIDARSDLDKFRHGCRTMENMIPRIYGPAERRPGTKYIATTTSTGRVVPFIYSNSIAYILLFENKKLYFYYNGAQVLNGGGTRLTVDTPYAGADLAKLQFKQLNDVMWITHPDYPPYKLSRTSATAFSLAKITFELGPFKTRNDIANDNSVTMKPSVTTGNGTLTASSSTFVAGHVGALFSVIQPRVDTKQSGSKTKPDTGVIGSAMLVEGTFTFTTSGTWEGEVKLERSIDGTTWEFYRAWISQITYTGTEEEEDIYYRINVVSLTSGTIKCLLTINSSTQEGVCEITGYTSGTVVSMTVKKAFASTNTDVRWSEGAWSAVQGYPKCMTFFKDRAVYASSTSQPQSIWLSATGDYEYFYKGTLDDASFWLTLASDERNAIEWISALESILIGTSGGTWRLRSNSYDEPITPTNFSITQQNTQGSKNIQALPINDVILYVDTVGRKVRELLMDGDRDKYAALDLTALAEHITDSGIIAFAYQQHPDSLLWLALADGTLLSMAYEREQKVVAWSKHPFSGE